MDRPPLWQVWRLRVVFIALVLTVVISPGWLHGDWRDALRALVAAVVLGAAVAAGIALVRPKH